MPQVTRYQNQVERTGTTTARLQAPEYGPNGFVEGAQSLGRAITQTADTMDQIAEVDARVEANRLLVEHSEASRAIGNTVKQTFGEQASAVADKGIEDLGKLTSTVLSKASPRARRMLESEIGQRNVVTKDSWLDHGFNEKVKAFDTTSQAAITSILEDATDEPDEDKALILLKDAFTKNKERADFFGKGSEWEIDQNRKVGSAFFKSRALNLAAGASGSATDAIAYAEAHRRHLTDDDYRSIVGTYGDAALDEVALAASINVQPTTVASTGEAKSGDPLAPLPEGQDEPPRKLDGRAFFRAFVSPHEGGAAVVTDSNGAIAKYGINAAHNPGIDVRNLTEGQAADHFYTKYFVGSGADKLPPALAAIHADTYYLNQKEANRILKASGGDPDKYIQMRSQFLNGLATSNPAKYGKYQAGWANRTRDLANFADRQGTNGVPINITAGTDLSDFRKQVLARTDIGMRLKMKIVQQFEARRADEAQDRSIRENEASRALTTAALNLGDGFTDIKQLPQSALLKASPSTISSFTDMAKSNRENKPLDPALASYINFVEVSDPKKFASAGFIKEITDKGAPLGTIRTVTARQGQIAGALANAKPDPVADGTLWTIAKPAFEASGLLYDTTESKGKDKAGENIADAQAKGQAVRFLREMAQHWAMANPGKKPDEATMRGWVGFALRQATPDKRVFQVNDADTTLSVMSASDKQRIVNEFKRQGVKPTVELVARAYRRLRATASMDEYGRVQ